MSQENENPRMTVTNYTKIWTLDWVVYALEGKKLPIPANLRVVAIFFVVELIFIILGKTILFFLPWMLKNILLPGFLTWIITKQKLDGKAPHKWLLGMIFFWMRPKHLHRYRKFEHNKHNMYGSKVVYRTKERA
jgi:hypothetical protein